MEELVQSDFAAAWDRFRTQLLGVPAHRMHPIFKHLLGLKRDSLTDDERSIVIRWCIDCDMSAWLDDFLTQFGSPTQFNFRAHGIACGSPAIFYRPNSCIDLLKLHLARQQGAPLEVQLGKHERHSGKWDLLASFNSQKNFHVLAKCFADCEQIESLVLFDLLPPDLDRSSAYHEDILTLACKGGQLKRLKLHQEELPHKSDDAAFFFLSEALRCNPRLEELYVGPYAMASHLKQASQLDSFVDQLSRLKALRRLSLRTHAWTSTQVELLLSALCALPGLNELVLVEANLSAEAAVAFAECVEAGVLTQLTLNKCRMTPAIHESLLALRIASLTCTEPVLIDENVQRS